MPQQRKPLSIPLVPRDATTSKDAKLVNVYAEDGPTGPETVKRPGISTVASLGTGCAQGSATFNGDALFILNDTVYSNFSSFALGAVWTSSTTPPKPTNNDVAGTTKPGYMVSHLGNLYHIGGKDNSDTNISVYKSTDNGASWTTILAVAPFIGSLLMPNQGAVSAGGRIYILLNTRAIWSTADGIAWILETADVAGGGTHNGQALILHNGILFALLSRNNANMTLFSSASGSIWTSVNGSISGPGNRTLAAFASLSGILYIIAGMTDATPLKNDVYKSSDNGATWSQATAAFSARSDPMVWTYNSKMFLAGGSTSLGGLSPVSDVYSSTDGATWTLITAAGGWTARRGASFTVHNNTMYLGPGLGRSGSNTVAVSSLHFAAVGGSSSAALPLATQPCLPMQIALIPAFGSTPTKAFIKSTKDAWVWDGTTVTKVVDADYPATTVFGVAYLDGTIYVMDSKGVIYGSDLLAPTSWNALNFISAISEADAGVAIARQLDNIIAFKESSIEFFYNAGNAVGSPLAKVPNALLEIGLAGSGGSIAYSDNGMFFMAQHRQKGRTIMKFEGTTPKEMSNPWVDRILYGDDLATVFGFVVRLQGHTFYMLTLKTSAITLVLDETYNKQWLFTKLKARPNITATSLVVQSNGSILVTLPSVHAASDGDPVVIAGGTPAAVNGSFNLRYDTAIHSASQFSYVPATSVSGSITGTITVTLYSSSQFPGAYYARGVNVDLILDETTGDIYKFDPLVFQDSGAPIDCQIVTDIEDFGTDTPKSYAALSLIGDTLIGNCLVRYSNDDYQTFSKYRLIDMSKKRKRATQLGSAERRSWQFRYTGNTAFRLSQAQPDITGWNA